jgi:hypothetical protein
MRACRTVRVVTHNFWPAVVIVPAALLIFVLMGGRVWLALSNRAPGPRLRRIIALDPDEERDPREGLPWAIFFSALAIFLLVVLVVNNLDRADGRFALLLGASGLAFAVAWIAAVHKATIPRQPPDEGSG